jgi:hypothetical protein
MNLELANALNVNFLDISVRIVSSEEKEDIFSFFVVEELYRNF